MLLIQLFLLIRIPLFCLIYIIDPDSTILRLQTLFYLTSTSLVLVMAPYLRII